jgi:hypothetical protein
MVEVPGFELYNALQVNKLRALPTYQCHEIHRIVRTRYISGSRFWADSSVAAQRHNRIYGRSGERGRIVRRNLEKKALDYGGQVSLEVQRIRGGILEATGARSRRPARGALH